ncbi:MAG: hypothetical protein BZ135_08795 [Methanosphaera sp. rholeuAM6]|nr:MAG: hypothetical protein BZ135_08795 [Methanosphaera sp. rholeuAM6]
MIKLVKPDRKYKDELLGFKEEFLSNDEHSIPGGELLDKMDSFDEWLDYVTRNTNPSTVSRDWVVSSTFLAVMDDEVVGIICLRHELNDFLKDFGHIGYSVRPSYRRRGIATFMLGEVLKYAQSIGLKSVQLSSQSDNTASLQTIGNSGGKYVRSFTYLDNSVCVFIIDL